MLFNPPHAAATWSTNDYPTALKFFTTADGASSPTERMRIDPTGMVRVRGADASGALNVFSCVGAMQSLTMFRMLLLGVVVFVVLFHPFVCFNTNYEKKCLIYGVLF